MSQQDKRNVEDEWRRIKTEEEGSLKEKLERLLQRASEKRPPKKHRLDEPREEELGWDESQGDDTPPVSFEGDLFAGGNAAECPFPADSYHGRIRIGSALELKSDILALISRDDAFQTVDPAKILYLDLETTGLSPGSSNYAFMVGLGYFAGDEFRVRQHFMRDFSDEIEILDRLEAFVAQFNAVVTFNGRAFDLPLIESRFVLARRRTRLSQLPHLDLLYPSRQIWRERFESCSLKSLEYNLLGVERHGDIPGAEIPHVYFEYLRSRNPYWISKIFHHNRLDIVSMMCLLSFCHDLVAGKHLAHDWQETLGLAFFYERRNNYEQSTLLFSEALETGADRERRVKAIRRASELHRKAGKRDEAMALWSDGAQEDGFAAIDFLRNMAIQLEHHERRYADALALVDDALDRIANLRDRGIGGAKLLRHQTDFEKRRDRLRKKVPRTGS